MTGIISPFSYRRVGDQNNAAHVGATLQFYVAGTPTPTATPVYSDITLQASLGASLTSGPGGYYTIHYLDPSILTDVVETISGMSRRYAYFTNEAGVGAFQPIDQTLTNIAGLTIVNRDLIQGTGPDTVAAVMPEAVTVIAAGTSTAIRLDGWAARIRWYLSASSLDGVADDVELQAQLDAMAAAGGGTLYLLGTFHIAATVNLPKHCALDGGIFGATMFYRTGDFGDTLKAGVNTAGLTAQGCGVKGIWFYHPHTYIAGTTTSLDNPVTVANGNAHIRVHDGQICVIESCYFTNLPYNVVLDGGFKIAFKDCRFGGIYDQTQAGLQEGFACVRIDRGTLNGTIPTNISFEECYITGTASEVRAVNWGAGSPVMSSENIGPRYGVYATCYEVLTYKGGYIGGNNEAGVKIIPAVIASGFAASDVYFDGARTSQVQITGGSVSAISTSFKGCSFFAAGVNKWGVEVGVNGATALAIGMEFAGNEFRDHVGAVLKLQGAIGVAGSANTFQNWNSLGLTLSDPDYAAAVYILGSGSAGLSRSMAWATNVFGSGDYVSPVSGSNYSKWGFYTAGTGEDETIVFGLNSWRGVSTGALLGGDINGDLAAAPTYPQNGVIYTSDGTASGTIGFGDSGAGPYAYDSAAGIFRALGGVLTTATAANLGAKAHASNTNGKYKGKIAVDAATGKGYVAGGATDVSVWWNITDGGSITPA